MSKQVRTIIIAIVAVVALSGVLAVLLLLPQMTGGQTDTSSAASTASNSSITLHNKLLGEDGKAVDTPVKNAEILLDKEAGRMPRPNGLPRNSRLSLRKAAIW